MEAPTFLLKHGCLAYIKGYGVVLLLERTAEVNKRSKEWKVFQCFKEGEVVAEIAAQKGWCRVYKRHFKLFGMPLLFLSSTRN
jgi:hypothetical protein